MIEGLNRDVVFISWEDNDNLADPTENEHCGFTVLYLSSSVRDPHLSVALALSDFHSKKN